MDDFLCRFVFNPNKLLYVGVELEAFVVQRGHVVPEGYELVQNAGVLPGAVELGHELFRSQVEFRSSVPIRLITLLRHIEDLETAMRLIEKQSGRSLLCQGFMEHVPLDVSPTARCRDIEASLPRDVLRAAGSVAGLHVHIGMPDLPAALYVYNRVRKELDDLALRYASQVRMQAYRTVTPFWRSPPIEGLQGLYELAVVQGFEKDLKRWWALIRITRFGTIEFRIADATRDPTTILNYTLECVRLCRKALNMYYKRAP